MRTLSGSTVVPISLALSRSDVSQLTVRAPLVLLATTLFISSAPLSVCAYVISAAPEREVYVEYQSTITVVLGGYPLPVQYSNIFCTVDSVSFPSGAAPVMAVPPDEANVTFSYPISASSTSPSTCSVYYRNSDTHCTDISVSIGELIQTQCRRSYCSLFIVQAFSQLFCKQVVMMAIQFHFQATLLLCPQVLVWCPQVLVW